MYLVLAWLTGVGGFGKQAGNQARIQDLVRGAQQSFDPKGALSQKVAQNGGFPLKLPENKKSWGKGGPAPLDALLVTHGWWLDSQGGGAKSHKTDVTSLTLEQHWTHSCAPKRGWHWTYSANLLRGNPQNCFCLWNGKNMLNLKRILIIWVGLYKHSKTLSVLVFNYLRFWVDLFRIIFSFLNKSFTLLLFEFENVWSLWYIQILCRVL